MTNWFRITIYTVFIIILQVWVFTPISLSEIGTPYVYVVLLMLFPMQYPMNKLLIYSFVVGSIIDILSVTPGLHTAILVPVALFRYYVAPLLIDKPENANKAPLFTNISYPSIFLLLELLLVQHILLFIIDSIGLFDWYFLIKRFVLCFGLSFFFSLILMLIFSAQVRFKKG